MTESLIVVRIVLPSFFRGSVGELRFNNLLRPFRIEPGLITVRIQNIVTRPDESYDYGMESFAAQPGVGNLFMPAGHSVMLTE